jgi:hypothetical protein
VLHLTSKISCGSCVRPRPFSTMSRPCRCPWVEGAAPPAVHLLVGNSSATPAPPVPLACQSSVVLRCCCECCLPFLLWPFDTPSPAKPGTDPSSGNSADAEEPDHLPMLPALPKRPSLKKAGSWSPMVLPVLIVLLLLLMVAVLAGPAAEHVRDNCGTLGSDRRDLKNSSRPDTGPVEASNHYE